jgi:hypothetical protein
MRVRECHLLSIGYDAHRAAAPCGIFATNGGKRVPLSDFALTLLPIPVDFPP